MLIGVAAFLGVVAVAQHKAQERVDAMMKRSQQVVGKAAVGGPFKLVDQVGGRGRGRALGAATRVVRGPTV
jgi:hypothetical protein